MICPLPRGSLEDPDDDNNGICTETEQTGKSPLERSGQPIGEKWIGAGEGKQKLTIIKEYQPKKFSKKKKNENVQQILVSILGNLKKFFEMDEYKQKTVEHKCYSTKYKHLLCPSKTLSIIKYKRI